jgi:hypothetical protein
MAMLFQAQRIMPLPQRYRAFPILRMMKDQKP